MDHDEADRDYALSWQGCGPDPHEVDIETGIHGPLHLETVGHHGGVWTASLVDETGTTKVQVMNADTEEEARALERVIRNAVNDYLEAKQRSR